MTPDKSKEGSMTNKAGKVGHTKGPWKIIAEDGVGIYAGQSPICEMAGHYTNGADAAFIVEACNNYDRLKALNRELVEVLTMFVNDEASEIRVPVSEWADSDNKWGRAKRLLKAKAIEGGL